EDSDGDGLADWEEILGVYGWFSNPNSVDTDADGVSDFDEVFDFTDPNEPCNNLLDDDGDTLNNYFEDTTGCDLIWIGIGNGSVDAWVTNPQVFDTDSGGVDDRTEYTDGTNPESNPLDDVLPEDFDGDGIPDAIENLTGTDWTNPDTDGGGMLDGDECPVAFWGTLCVNSPYDPFDPTDDIVENGVVFWANNTTGDVDLSQVHRWRLSTNDFYTGSTYASLQDIHPYSPLIPNVDNLSQLPDPSFSNGTLDWEITYKQIIDLGNLPVSSYYRNITFWSDPAATLQRSNDTHNVNIDFGEITQLNLRQDEYFFDWDTLSSNTVASQGFDYQLILPTGFSDQQSPDYIVNQTVANIVQDASSTDAYSIAQSLSDYLRFGNETQEFDLFHTPVNRPTGSDVTSFVLNSGTGQCKDYNTAFVTMARLAGIPSRYVTGYVGGQWNGVGYTVSTQDFSSWGEVKLSFNSGSGLVDLGWIPFDSCPQAENLTILNQSISPLTIDRNLADVFDFSGQFAFADNTTPIADYDLLAYLVPVDNPQIELTEELFVGEVITDSNGNFSFSDLVTTPLNPGVYSLLIRHSSFELISDSSIIFDNWINITEDSLIIHEFPLAIGAPVVGAGSTTTIQGIIEYQNAPEAYSLSGGESSVYLSFTSSFNGSNNISGIVAPSGAWSINIELDETENLGLLSAEIWYEGWTQEFDPQIATSEYHLRPSSINILLDVREAPNLTATVEGPLSNNSILVVNEDIWVNGTAKSLGPSPIDMEGQLVLSIRENGSFDSWSDIFNITVNGTFAIQQQLTAQLATFGAGELEVRLRFTPLSIAATDDANLSAFEPYRLQSYLQFGFESTPQLRGYDGIFSVRIFDHRGERVGQTIGDYDFSFNNSWFNTTSNLSTQTQKIVPLDANLVAGDYAIAISYNGSDDYAPSEGNGTLRVKAEIGWNITVSQNWTHLGDSVWINGSIYDAVYQSPILGDNVSQYSMVLISDDGRNIDLAQGLVDNITSTFSENITLPTILPSNAYDIEIRFDFYTQQPDGGPYYASEEPVIDTLTESISVLPTPTVLAGIESEFVVELAESEKITTLTNNDLQLSTVVTDLADSSLLAGVLVEFFFDYNGSNVSMGTSQTDANGTANLTWNAAGIAPGAYEILVLVADDLTDPLAKGNSRHLGNSTALNITIQGNTDFRIDSIPATITAGVDFNVVGQVIDADDNSRVLIDSVKLKANWLNNENETLVSSFTTLTNGSFNMSVPTDTQNNGTLRGAKTLVISVIEGSSPFYLESSTEAPVFVFGVTQFESIQPLNAIVVNRGDSVNITSRLVESSNLFQPLSGYDVSYEFRGSPIGTVQTDGEGFANVSHTIPFSQPLGLTNVQITFTGSSDLLATEANFSTINVRSLTFIVVDDITANPVAGELFNISGQITSDNGSGLEQVDGTVLPANILFEINDESLGFTVAGGVVGVDGYWNASIRLSTNFAAGNNTLSATYIPAVNFYLGSNTTSLFDSRGFSEIRFIDPALDLQGQPSLNDRVERGNDIEVEVLLIDNTGEPVSGQLITISLNGTDITTIITTAENGTAFGVLTTPENMSVGVKDVNALFTGTPGTTGLLGSEANTSFVVLAQ
ncbi:MAG: transglutaminase domain-containing protein, partial [Candidatus Thermoplasmatota archaeon]|nr:transglutaminase domain-containing protein [Candidatus Thermoplasmatota archaeon]